MAGHGPTGECVCIAALVGAVSLHHCPHPMPLRRVLQALLLMTAVFAAAVA